MGIMLSTPAMRSDWVALTTTYAVCSLLLHVIFKTANFYALPAERPVEDEPIKAYLPIPKLMAYPVSETKRQRIHANTVENCYLSCFWAAFVMTFIQSISGKGHEEARALTILIAMYTTGRAGFFLGAYANAWQPWRTLFFSLGQVSSLALAATAIIVMSAARTDFSRVFPA